MLHLPSASVVVGKESLQVVVVTLEHPALLCVLNQEVDVTVVVLWGLLVDLEARVVRIHYSLNGDGPIGHHLQILVVYSRSECEKDSISAGDPELGDFLIFFGNKRRKGHFTIPEGQVVVLPVVVANAELLVHGQSDGR